MQEAKCWTNSATTPEIWFSWIKEIEWDFLDFFPLDWIQSTLIIFAETEIYQEEIDEVVNRDRTQYSVVYSPK